jgi:hypothetical protein
MKRIAIVLAAAGALSATACTTEKFTEPMVLGGVEIDAETLNLGHDAYMLYCYACHGENGDGQGPASHGLWPPPRDFRKGIFKFGGVPEGELPSDDDLIRIVRNGLTGTAMLPWEIPDEQLWLAIQYIKTFSMEDAKGRKYGFKKPNKKQQALSDSKFPPDPYGEARKEEAIEIGEKRYHTGGCNLCHPAYVSPTQIAEWRADNAQLRATHPYDADPKVSDAYGVVLVPPDFLRMPVRTAKRHYDAQGHLHFDVKDFYRILASGVPGTAMPSWASLPPQEVWAVSYYVAHLAEMRDTREARTMRDALLSAPPAPPPPEPPPAPEPAPAPEGGAPEGAAPAPAGGAPEGGAPAGGAPEGGAPEGGAPG